MVSLCALAPGRKPVDTDTAASKGIRRRPSARCRYMGLKQPRLRGDAYYEIVDEFVQAVMGRWPRAVLQVPGGVGRRGTRGGGGVTCLALADQEPANVQAFPTLGDLRLSTLIRLLHASVLPPTRFGTAVRGLQHRARVAAAGSIPLQPRESAAGGSRCLPGLSTPRQGRHCLRSCPRGGLSIACRPCA